MRRQRDFSLNGEQFVDVAMDTALNQHAFPRHEVQRSCALALIPKQRQKALMDASCAFSPKAPGRGAERDFIRRRQVVHDRSGTGDLLPEGQVGQIVAFNAVEPTVADATPELNPSVSSTRDSSSHISLLAGVGLRLMHPDGSVVAVFGDLSI